MVCLRTAPIAALWDVPLNSGNVSAYTLDRLAPGVTNGSGGSTWTTVLDQQSHIQQLDVTDLFREQGRYTYRNGVNMRAIAALVIAILPVVPGFIRAVSVPGGTVSDPTFFDRLYSYAWFVTFVLSFVLYLLFMRGSNQDRP